MRGWLIGLLSAVVFLLTTGLVVAQPTFTIEPSSGPVGTRFIHTVSGLEPNTEYQFVLRDPTGRVDRLTFQTALAGRYSTDWRSEPGEPTGVYTVQLTTTDGSSVLASATFSVTGTGMGAGAAAAAGPAELPRSGDLSGVAPALAAAGLGLIGAGYGLRRRSGRRR